MERENAELVITAAGTGTPLTALCCAVTGSDVTYTHEI